MRRRRRPKGRSGGGAGRTAWGRRPLRRGRCPKTRIRRRRRATWRIPLSSPSSARPRPSGPPNTSPRRSDRLFVCLHSKTLQPCEDFEVPSRNTRVTHENINNRGYNFGRTAELKITLDAKITKRKSTYLSGLNDCRYRPQRAPNLFLVKRWGKPKLYAIALTKVLVKT